jgi:hypothetical protein
MRPVFAVLILSVTASACGGSPSPAAPASTTSSSADALSRVIWLDGSLAFGNTQVGITLTAPIGIDNGGTGAMTVSGLTLPSGYTASWTSGTIPANHRQSLEVTFAPTAVQTYNGTVTVNADQTSGTNTMALVGAGVPPSLNVPTLISPANGAVLPQGPVGNRGGTTWTFTWSGVPGTTAYQLYVWLPGQGGSTVDVTGITTTTYAWVTTGGFIAANLQGWQWMVQSNQGWSQIGTFSVAPAGSTPTSLAVGSLIRRFWDRRDRGPDSRNQNYARHGDRQWRYPVGTPYLQPA